MAFRLPILISRIWTSTKQLECKVMPQLAALVCSRPRYLHSGKSLQQKPGSEKLMEFFDTRENWGEPKIKSGRPWRIEELRIKGNEDLHKLWYVCLVERNMLMTMEEEYKRQSELFPNPERFEKVEETLDNILTVIAERDKAVNLLETGETGQPEKRWAYNPLGIGHWRREKEHYKMAHQCRPAFDVPAGWQNVFKRLLREKRLRARRNWEYRHSKYIQHLKKQFPNADIEDTK